MNAESITGWLAAVGVPPEVVSVGAEADNAWCLLRERQTDDGGPAWEVFWREQGNRYDWARFTNEQVACHYLFGRLTWSQVVRGAVGVLVGADRNPPASQAGPPPGDQAATADDATPPVGTPRITGNTDDADDATPPTGIPVSEITSMSKC